LHNRPETEQPAECLPKRSVLLSCYKLCPNSWFSQVTVKGMDECTGLLVQSIESA
jgi:hypothetical protein